MTDENSMPATESPAASGDALGEILGSVEREEITQAEEPADQEEQAPAEEPADEEQDRPKKLSGAQRAKRREEYLLNEIQERDRRLEERERRLEELEHHVSQGGERGDEERRQRHHEAHLDRIKDARGVIADFDATMSKMAGVAIHNDVIEEIVSSDKSPLLAYHLAKNPDKLRELNSMGARQMAREIGRLETTLKMPEGRKQTKAPPPMTSLKGGAAPHTALEKVDDMGVFAKRLIKDLESRNRR